MELVIFIFMMLCIVFIFMNKFIGIVFLISCFNILFLLFGVVLNKKYEYLTTLGAVELTISIMSLIYSILVIFCNVNIINVLFK